jgi:hypothetical protein
VAVTHSWSWHGGDLVVDNDDRRPLRLPLIPVALFVADWLAKAVYLAALTGSSTKDTAHTVDTVLKVSAMVTLAVWFVATARSDAPTRRLPIFVGLLLAACADLATQVRDQKFYVGLLLFLVVHLLYLGAIPWRALSTHARRWTWAIASLVLVAVVLLVVFAAARPTGCRPVANFCLAVSYAFVSAATVVAFLAVRKIPDVRRTRYLAAGAGLGAFLLSDLVLFVDSVTRDSPDCAIADDGRLVPALMAIVLYQAGQYTFATGVGNA